MTVVGARTTPEAVHPDRDVGSTDYVAAGVMTAPTYLKWALLYEEPDSRTVWIAKALPRDWLEVSADQIEVHRATTRYGRVSYTLDAVMHETNYTVFANVTLDPRVIKDPPAGGVKLRLRAPLTHAGKLKAVTVGGQQWTAFDPKAETVDFSLEALTAKTVEAMATIVATFD